MILTANRKKVLFNTTLFLLLMTGIILMFTVIGWIGKANAGTGAVDPNDPQGLAIQFYDYIRNGAHLPAVGVALMLVVWGLRYGATKLPKIGPWFVTTTGGWVLGFGSAALLYIGTAFTAGQSITIGLLMQAFGTGFAASGKWEGLRDLIGKWKNNGAQPTMGIVAKTGLVAILVTSALACSGCPGPTPQPVQDVVDCGKEDQAQITAYALTCATKQPDWSAVEACAIDAAGKIGWKVGGCVLADLVQQYLTKKGAPVDPPQTKSAHDALEDYRTKEAHGATFKTKDGSL